MKLFLSILTAFLILGGCGGSGNEYDPTPDIQIKTIKGEKFLDFSSIEKRFIIFEFHTAVKLIIDPDTGNIMDANRASELFYGWPKEQLKQMNVRDINLNSPEKIHSLITSTMKTHIHWS